MDEKESLGSYLKRERESKKISLREVAKTTRVREHILRAVEEDRFDLLPSPTYVKGFVVAYAKFLRLDSNEVLERYERTLRKEPATPPPPTSPKPKQKIPSTPSSKSRYKIHWKERKVWWMGGVVIASLVVLYLLLSYAFKSSVETPIVPSSSVPSTTSQGEKPIPEGEQPLTPSSLDPALISSQEKRLFSIQLKALEETWISLQLDGRLEKEVTLKPGEGFSAQASKEIRIIVGNAGGLDLVLNGKPLDKFGKSGEVLILIFNSQGVEVRRPEKPKPVQE